MNRQTLQDWFDRFLGRGSAAVTVPPLDGALKPNNLLEEAKAGLNIAEPDNLIRIGNKILFSHDNFISSLNGAGEAVPFLAVVSEITALAATSSGVLAVATKDHGIAIYDSDGTPRKITWSDQQLVNCVTAMGFAGEETLIVCVGSAVNVIDDWQRDLLNNGHSGSLWKLDISTGKATSIADRLSFPNGVMIASNGDYIVSESWKKRLIRINSEGKITAQLIEDLPGYPSRISPSERGGYWLCVFAPRSQLIEFVLREPAYRNAMMAEVRPEYWIAPSLRSGVSFHEPMQGGALKQMGILKPWAPTQSYGLIIELNENFVPIRSLHSRAGGKRHGMTSAVALNHTMWATSKGGDEVITVALTSHDPREAVVSHATNH